MKRKMTSILIAAAVLIGLAGCSTNTITEKPGEYVYKENEEIKIIDIDTRDTMGTLKMTGMHVLKDEPFVITETDGTDEDGKTRYKDVTYSQLLQICYQYKNTGANKKKITVSNFDILDRDDNLVVKSPQVEYKAIQSQDDYFVVALKNRSDSVSIKFNYDVLQMKPTARIELGESAKAPTAQTAPPAKNNTETGGKAKPAEKEPASAQDEPAVESVQKNANSPAGNASESNTHLDGRAAGAVTRNISIYVMGVVILGMSAVIAMLLVIIIVMSNKKRLARKHDRQKQKYPWEL